MNTISQNILKLNKNDQHRIFFLMLNNADLFNKIIPGIPLLEYILTGTDTTANDNELVQAYSAWKSQN